MKFRGYAHSVDGQTVVYVDNFEGTQRELAQHAAHLSGRSASDFYGLSWDYAQTPGDKNGVHFEHR